MENYTQILARDLVGTPTPAGDFSVLALRTLMKVVAGYTGKSFAQVQADFKAQWNADFSDQQLS